MGKEAVLRALQATQMVIAAGEELLPVQCKLTREEIGRQEHCVDSNICFCCEERRAEVTTLPCRCRLWCTECVKWFMNNGIHFCYACTSSVINLQLEDVIINVSSHLENVNLVREGFCVYCKTNNVDITADCGCQMMCNSCSSIFLRAGPRYICHVCFKGVSALILGGGDRVLDLKLGRVEFLGELKYTQGAIEGSPKTELCHNWLRGLCSYFNCLFAHGISELRPVIRHRRFRTELCNSMWMGIRCKYAERCKYRHQPTQQEHEAINAMKRSFLERIDQSRN